MDNVGSIIPTGYRKLVSSQEWGAPDLNFGVGKSHIPLVNINVQSGRLLQPRNSGNLVAATDIGLAGDENSGSYLSETRVSRHKVCQLAHSKFVEIATFEFFEHGYTPPSEIYIRDFATTSPGMLGELAQGISLKEAGNSKVMVALLNAIGALPYEDVHPFGQVLAIAATTNPAAEVKEAAMRVYETWGHPEGADILAAVECPWPWLEAYRNQVISDLRAEG